MEQTGSGISASRRGGPEPIGRIRRECCHTRGKTVVKALRSAFLLILLAATPVNAEDKLCVTKQWYGALALADMEQAIVHIYRNDTAALNRMMDDNRVGIFHAGTEVLIKKRYISKNGNNLIHIRKLGTAHELWTHMAAVACR